MITLRQLQDRDWSKRRAIYFTFVELELSVSVSVSVSVSLSLSLHKFLNKQDSLTLSKNDLGFKCKSCNRQLPPLPIPKKVSSLKRLWCILEQ